MSSKKPKMTFSIEKAHQAQIALSRKIVFENRIPREIKHIAGVDVAYVNGFSIAAVTVLNFKTLKLEEAQTLIRKTSFPYIPTLLSFREISPVLQCIRKLHASPDVFLADGHGYAHPYRCGFASHLGLVLRKPTIGVAKSILVGEVERQTNENVAWIRDDGEIIGAEIKATPNAKPVYVSVGHMISLKTAIRIVKHCTIENHIPQPLLLAHKAANAEKRKVNITTLTQERNG
jgi:deoxyribonuclease V